MRVLFLLMLVVVATACASPIDPAHWLINRPTETPYLRARRSPQYTKGEAPAKGHVPLTRTQGLNLRKGEFLCGNRVCKLQPGEQPKNCNGVCQYPV